LEEVISPELLFYLGMLLGVILRTLLPWLKKKAEDPTIKFDPRFVWTATLAVISTFIEVAAILAGDPTVIINLGLRFALLAGFFFGLGNNELWNRILHSGKKE